MKLFAYGTLQEVDVQIRLLGRPLDRRPAALNGWRKKKIFAEDGYYWGLQKGKDQVWGSILEVEQEDFAKLDEYEGNAYERINTRTSEGDLVSVYIISKWLLRQLKQKQKNAEQKVHEKN